MSIRCQCFCGARYDVADVYAGKRVECPKCGSRIAVPTGLPADLEPFDLADDDGGQSVGIHKTAAWHEAEAVRASLRKAPKGMSAPPPVVIETSSGFWRDAGESFLLFFSLEACFTILFLCFISVMVTFLSAITCLGLILGLLFYGYLCSFYMRTVRRAAAGDTGIPRIGIGANFVDDMVLPMFQWLGCQLFVLAPAIIAAVLCGLYTVPSSISIGICGVLGAMGMFFWPIFLLAVALGGFSMLYRFDRCVAAVFRSPGPYLLICLLLLVAVAPPTAAQVYIYFHGSKSLAEVLGIGSFTLWLVLLGLETYGLLVCSRLIGLYYHHFKEDFPWDLG